MWLQKLQRVIACFFRSEEGTEVVEWAMVAGLLVIVAVAAWPFIGASVEKQLNALLAAML